MTKQNSQQIRKWWILFTMCLLSVMLNFDVTAVNLAIPVIAHEMQASLASMQWIINAFVSNDFSDHLFCIPEKTICTCD